MLSAYRKRRSGSDLTEARRARKRDTSTQISSTHDAPPAPSTPARIAEFPRHRYSPRPIEVQVAIPPRCERPLTHAYSGLWPARCSCLFTTKPITARSLFRYGLTPFSVQLLLGPHIGETIMPGGLSLPPLSERVAHPR